MKTFVRSLCVAAVAALGAAPLTGCTVDAGGTVETVPAQSGSVTLRWSVDGSFDPGACDAFAVADARVDIYDDAGAVVQTRFVDCRNFRDTVSLYPGRYSARVQMTDAGQQPRSTSLPVSSFTVIANTDLTVDVDFPRDSFY